MGSFEGHVLPGVAFLLLGFWHLFNNIKLHTLSPNSFKSFPWFPISKFRYLELYFIIFGSSISVSMELVIGPSKHHPFDTDGTIPSNHLRNFEHASISFLFIVYATLAIFLDKIKHINTDLKFALTQLIGAISFCQQFFLFRLHSTDHHGLEGQYHLLLQFLVLVSLSTTLVGLYVPKSFLIGFVRSVSIIFQGIWFIVTGYMLWTPSLVPKGCLIHDEDGHFIVRCSSEEALNRAKSLVNIQFSWLIIVVTIFSFSFYIFMVEIYGKKVMYSSINKEFEDLEDESSDVESPNEKTLDDSKKALTAFCVER